MTAITVLSANRAEVEIWIASRGLSIEATFFTGDLITFIYTAAVTVAPSNVVSLTAARNIKIAAEAEAESNNKYNQGAQHTGNGTFEVGSTYTTRSACDSNSVYEFVVINRTKSFVTLQERGKSLGKKKIFQDTDGREYCKPHGDYSMATILKA